MKNTVMNVVEKATIMGQTAELVSKLLQELVLEQRWNRVDGDNMDSDILDTAKETAILTIVNHLEKIL